MRVFLTGGTGFLGSHLSKALARQPYEVRCLVRRSSHKHKIERLKALGFEIIEGDLRHPASYEAHLIGVEAVIHLAAIVEGSPKELLAVNGQGTAHLIKAAQTAGVKRFIHMSSLGASSNRKYPYGFSVWRAEQEIKSSALDYVILRSSVIVGQGDPFIGGLAQLIQKSPIVPVIGSGKTRFQPIWVEDVVKCIIFALHSEGPSRKTIPIGGGEILSLEEIVDAIMQALKIKRRKIHLPRRATRAVVKALKRLGINTPFVPGHFLGSDNVAKVSAVETHFGFCPRALRELLHEFLGKPVAEDDLNVL